jgi:cell envelope opacity-associated protein A
MNFTNPNDWGLAGEMNKLQKLQKENAKLNNEIKRINSEKNKCDKDIKAMTREQNMYRKDINAITRAKIECQKKLTEAEENAKLHTNSVLLERIAVLNKNNEQLRDQVKMLEDENMTKSQTYRNSVLRKSISDIQNRRRESQSKSVKGGKTNKKIKSKRKHTRKRF